jgi:hypothetical protein
MSASDVRVRGAREAECCALRKMARRDGPEPTTRPERNLTLEPSAVSFAVTPQSRNPPFPAGSSKRMMGFEPTTFCMASRCSSQLSYIRVALRV